MVMERYNVAVVKNCISALFGLMEDYNNTIRNVIDIMGLGDNPPAGVVPDLPTNEDKQKIDGLLDKLDVSLRFTETRIPYEINSQENIANLLRDVRCYLDSKKRE